MVAFDPTTATILDDSFLGCGDMRGAYDREHILPTSEHADIFLIRSHIAYWAGRLEAARATIKPSRGHSYSITIYGQRSIVRIADHYDHRAGVVGYTDTTPCKNPLIVVAVQS